jgi:hypothetical protein
MIIANFTVKNFHCRSNPPDTQAIRGAAPPFVPDLFKIFKQRSPSTVFRGATGSPKRPRALSRL